MKNLKFLITITLFACFFVACDKEPSSVDITRIVYRSIPDSPDPNSSFWDTGSFPDCYPDIYYIITDDLGNNVAQGGITWDLGRVTPPADEACYLTIHDFNKIYTISIYDFDILEEDDSIGSISFRMADYLVTKDQQIFLMKGDLQLDLVCTWK